MLTPPISRLTLPLSGGFKTIVCFHRVISPGTAGGELRIVSSIPIPAELAAAVMQHPCPWRQDEDAGGGVWFCMALSSPRSSTTSPCLVPAFGHPSQRGLLPNIWLQLPLLQWDPGHDPFSLLSAPHAWTRAIGAVLQGDGVTQLTSSLLLLQDTQQCNADKFC